MKIYDYIFNRCKYLNGKIEGTIYFYVEKIYDTIYYFFIRDCIKIKQKLNFFTLSYKSWKIDNTSKPGISI